jgi:hypothetical protein
VGTEGEEFSASVKMLFIWFQKVMGERTVKGGSGRGPGQGLGLLSSLSKG